MEFIGINGITNFMASKLRAVVSLNKHSKIIK